ncbi:MAG: replicative DNA helicase [Proteobacteria bacterium]|nr:replicative DNA helicase [Pseudomonadota bacterium]
MGDQGNVRKLTIVGEGPFARVQAAAPHSVEAEQALLGAVMLDNRLLEELEKLRPDHFYVPLHAAVFEAVDHLVNQRGVEANPISVKERLKGSSFDAEKDLFPHLKDLFENAGLAGDVKALFEVIHTTYLQRQLVGLSEGMRTEALKAVTPERTSEIVSQVGDELHRLAETGKRNTQHTMRESLRAMFESAGRAKSMGGGLTGVGTGLVDLDRLLGGLQRSDLIILGARPSMGKTSLLLNIAQHAAQRRLQGGHGGAAVGFFSLEMSHEQLAQRMSAGVAKLDSQRIASGHLTDQDLNALARTAGELADLPLHVDDGAALTIQEIRGRARQMKRRHGIGLLVVDYLQLITAPGRRNEQNRVQEVTEISQGLKQIARELDIPVLVASQLSRNVESRDNKRPQLSDLRESGSIEQDADVAAFLYRPEYYLARELGGGTDVNSGTDAERRKVIDLQDRLEKSRGLTELIIAKNRKGPIDTVKLLFKPETTTFTSFSAQGY